MRRTVAKAGRCKKTGKVSYRDEASAMLIANRTDWPDPDYAPIRAYPCEFCHQWHLTSREERPLLKEISNATPNPKRPARRQRRPR